MSRRSARERRLAAAAAVKERRKKFLAFGGLGLLVIALAIQGPRMVDLFAGSSEAVPAPAPQATTEPEEEETPRPQLGAATDPFALRNLASNDPAAARSAPDDTRDPFLPPASPASAPEPVAPPTDAEPAPPPPLPLPSEIVLGTPNPNAKATRAWIVIMASIPIRSGRASAIRFASRARSNGVTSVDVLESSTRRPLRAGYYVVYNGPYPTLPTVQRARAHIHALGYRTAYVRPILRY